MLVMPLDKTSGNLKSEKKSLKGPKKNIIFFIFFYFFLFFLIFSYFFLFFVIFSYFSYFFLFCLI